MPLCLPGDSRYLESASSIGCNLRNKVCHSCDRRLTMFRVVAVTVGVLSHRHCQGSAAFLGKSVLWHAVNIRQSLERVPLVFRAECFLVHAGNDDLLRTCRSRGRWCFRLVLGLVVFGIVCRCGVWGTSRWWVVRGSPRFFAWCVVGLFCRSCCSGGG